MPRPYLRLRPDWNTITSTLLLPTVAGLRRGRPARFHSGFGVRRLRRYVEYRPPYVRLTIQIRIISNWNKHLYTDFMNLRLAYRILGDAEANPAGFLRVKGREAAHEVHLMAE